MTKYVSDISELSMKSGIPATVYQKSAHEYTGECAVKDLLERKRRFFTAKLYRLGWQDNDNSSKAKNAVLEWASYASLHRKHAEYIFDTHRYWGTEKVPEYRPPRHGILLCGGCGIGKTMLMESIAKPEVTRRGKDYTNGFIFRTASWMIERFNREGHEFVEHIKHRWQWQHLIIDDLGAESTGQHYGQKWDMADFITWRYECFKGRYGVTTAFTSNLDREKLVQHYGNDNRIRSRLSEMVVEIRIEGYDWRMDRPSCAEDKT